MMRNIHILAALFVMVFAMAGQVAGDDAKPAAAKDAEKAAKPAEKATADNEASLDDLLKLTPDRKPTDEPEPAPAKIEDAAATLTGNESIDILLKAIAEMEQAGQRLSVRQDPGLETQRIQESILKRLDQAIATAKQQKQQQQQQQSQAGKGQKQETGSPQNQPQKTEGNQQSQKPGDKQPNKGESQDQASKGQVDPHEAGGPLDESRIEWGRLPARLRGELDQALSEKFSPIYKRLTEAYYRRLAEEGKD